MKLLFLNAYFYPEVIAFSHLEQDLMEGLVNAGHSLSVICPTPSRGVSKEISRKYTKIKHETLNGVEVHRFRAPCEGKNPLIRAFRYFWCHFRGDMIAKRQKDVDAVFAVSAPPTQGYFAGKVAKKLGVPLIYSLQDIFPGTLISTGLVSSDRSFLYRLGSLIEKKTYERCRMIIVLSKTVHRNLIDKGVQKEKLTTVCNWIDPDEVRPVSRADNRLFDEFHIDRNKFVAVYAGSFGISHGADVLLYAAEKLKENTEILFVIFGAGTEYDKAKKLAEEKDLTNIRMFPLLPAERISEVYSMGDVALIIGKKMMGSVAMPSKTWSIMACNTPIIASFAPESELAAILRESGTGICAEAEDPAALAEAIKDAFRRRFDGKNTAARDYVKAHASKKVGVAKYISCIENACKNLETPDDGENAV